MKTCMFGAKKCSWVLGEGAGGVQPPPLLHDADGAGGGVDSSAWQPHQLLLPGEAALQGFPFHIPPPRLPFFPYRIFYHPSGTFMLFSPLFTSFHLSIPPFLSFFPYHNALLTSTSYFPLPDLRYWLPRFTYSCVYSVLLSCPSFFARFCFSPNFFLISRAL